MVPVIGENPLEKVNNYDIVSQLHTRVLPEKSNRYIYRRR